MSPLYCRVLSYKSILMQGKDKEGKLNDNVGIVRVMFHVMIGLFKDECLNTHMCKLIRSKSIR